MRARSPRWPTNSARSTCCSTAPVSAIRCNAICPGTIATPSLEDRIAAEGAQMVGGPDAARRAFVERQPLGRLGTAEEVAALAVYLAADESAFTTGATHVIDGGFTLCR